MIDLYKTVIAKLDKSKGKIVIIQGRKVKEGVI